MSFNSNTTLIKNSIFLLIKLLFTLFITLYSSRLILQELGVVDFGIYNVVAGVVLLLSFLTGALTSSTQRFLSFEMGKKNKNISKIFSMSLNVYLIIAIIVILLSQTIGIWFVTSELNIPEERREVAFWVFQGAVLSFIFAVFTAPYNAMIITCEKMKLFSAIGVFTVLIKLFMIVLLTVIEGDKLLLFSLFMVGIAFITFFIPYLYCRLNICDAKYLFSWDSDLFKTLVGYTGWNLFGNLAAVGFNQGVSILLNVFFGPTVNAARAVSSQVNAALLGFSANVNTAINPQIIKNYSAGDKERMLEIVFNGSKYTFLFLSFISIPTLVNVDYILSIWLVEVPKYSIEFTVLVILDSLVCGFSGSLMTSIQATGKIKYYQMIIGGILLLNIPISYGLLLYFENPVIPFLVTISLSFIAFNCRLLFVKLYLSISIVDYYKDVVIGSVGMFIFSITTVLFIKNILLKFDSGFIIISLISVFVSFFYMWMFALNRSEKRFFKKLLVKIWLMLVKAKNHH